MLIASMKRIIFAFLACATLANAAADRRLRVLILTGETDLPYHDWRLTTPFIREFLANTGRFEVKALEEPHGLTKQTIAGYDVLVLNYNGSRWGRESEEAVEEFLRSGKGMVAFHGVSYGEFFGMVKKQRWEAGPDRGWLAYADMMGATWKPENIGHSLRHVFPVKWIDREHPIARGLEPTFLANDELYHKMDLRPNAHVIATAYSDPELRGTGRDEPIIWTVPFGQGRVVHITLGHDTAAMYQPGVATAFARSTEWAATGAVTLPATISAVPVPKKDAVRVLVVTGGHAYPASFYTLFEGREDIAWSHATSQKQAFTPKMKDRYDVLVLHDMYNDIAEPERAALRAFVEAGKGVISIHHSIVDYTSWPWWYEEVIGGKYFQNAEGSHPKSSFKEGVEVVARPAKGVRHPVLRGIMELPLEDEVYRDMWHSPNIKVLMETDHPLNDRPVVWVGPYPKARVLYIQLGHSDSTMRHPGYRQLVYNAILWSAGRLN